MEIYVTKPYLAPIEEFEEELKDIFESRIVTNMGPKYKEFQRQIIKYLNVPNLSLFTNGHLALEMALQALELPKGGEVITTPFTFVSTTHAIIRRGLIPVFADIKADDYTIDPEKIEELITDKTVAIVPVHVYGHICDVDRIQKIADKHGLKVLYDAAHAFGEEYKGTSVGNFGDMTMFSFHATKVFNTIEGGAVSFHNPKFKRSLHELKNFGFEDEVTVTAVGGNAKLDDIRCAMGICNLRHLDECIEERKCINTYYDERFKDIDGLKIGVVPEGLKANYGYYPIEVDSEIYGASRDDIHKALEKVGIHARKYFYPIISELQVYKEKYGFESVDVPIAKKIGDRIITIPIYPGLEETVQEKICNTILGLRG